jgi:hypothetical protein
MKTNKFFERDGYMVGVTAKGQEFYFDLQDKETIVCYNWHIAGGYVRNNKLGSMQNYFMNPKDGEIVDHRNRVKHDNRRFNLRICSHSNNCLNKTQMSNNSSGYHGITCTKYGTFRVEIGFKKKRYYLGTFKDLNIAIETYNKKAIELHGEYAVLNKLRKDDLNEC